MPLPVLLITALLAQAAPSTEPAATQSTFEQDRAEHERSVAAEFAALPQGPKLPVGRIVSITIDDGNLLLRPLLPPKAGAVRVDATDWPGYLQCAVGDPKSLFFAMKHVDTRDPLAIATYTHVSTQVDNLNINRDTEDANGLLSVTLIQSRQLADENDLPIRLTVRHTFEDQSRPIVDKKFAAESFAALRQQYPRELRTYLLPIFRDLGAAGLINSSTPAMAWQVLGDVIPVEAQLQAKLDAITPRLNADDFQARAAAEDELANLGPDAAAALRRVDLSTLPPDPATALRLFRKSREPATPQRAAELEKDVDFLIDTLLLDDARLRDAAAARLQAVLGTTIDLPPQVPAAERVLRVEALRDRFMPSTRPASQ